MYGRILSFGFRTAVAFWALTLVAASSWAGETKLHNFGTYPNGGAGPTAPLLADASGNLYGTTNDGGDIYCTNQQQYCGTIFQMVPNGSGGYTFTKLHNFGATGDGAIPDGGLVMDASGNLYGTTYNGGSDNDGGIVYQMTPNGHGGFAEKKLHNFGSGVDGAHPYAGMIIDPSGNLFGTTLYGGDYNGGTIFEMYPNGSGGWTEKKLYNFNPSSTNGSFPLGTLVMDASGNLYGTASSGGSSSCGFQGKCGTVFELSPNGSGGWTLHKLHDFQNNNHDGYSPHAGLTFDAAGNLYGTTTYGGAFNAGVVYELMPGGGGWTESVLYSFGASQNDGKYPLGNVVLDSAGNVYSTTSDGGSYICNNTGCGTAFELVPGQPWTETKLHNFSSNNQDGYTPQSGLSADSQGNLYGTTYYGGANGTGTVFTVTH